MAHITVHVQNPLGNPVQGVTVSVDGQGWDGTTDGGGNFDFGDVNPGQYTVKGSLGPATAPSQTKSAPGGATTPFLLTLPWTLTGQWLDAQVLCGDNAKLQVTVTPTPPDGQVTVEVLHPSTGATVDTLTGTMTGGTIQLTWVAKAQTASWRTDKMSFRATASSAGIKGTSSNQFAFRARPTTDWILRNTNRGTPTGFAAVCEKVDARLEAERVHYSLKLKLAGAAFDATKQADAKSRIETIWNNGFSAKKFHRKSCKRGQTCDCRFDCCKADFRLDANFVASGEHYTVTIKPSADPAHPDHSGTSCSGSTWADPPIAVTTSYAHEVGHMLGQFDEYSGGGTDPSGVQPVDPPGDNLMKTAGDTTLLNRHYRWVLEFLNANSGGDQYEVIPP